MRAWHPTVPGVREVLHAQMTDHVYPLHAHGDWALMLVDEGAVTYDLGGRARVADASAVTLLPPNVAHDGRAAPRSTGFRKRVAYLDASWMSEALAGRVVDQPTRADLVADAHRAHRALAVPGEESPRKPPCSRSPTGSRPAWPVAGSIARGGMTPSRTACVSCWRRG